MKRMWLLFDGSIWYEELLRISGWTDEHLRPPHAFRVRERVPSTELERVVITDHHGGHVSSVITEPVKPVANFKPTHVYNGSHVNRNGQCVYLADGVIEKGDGDLRIATFSGGYSMYVLTTDVEPIPKERDELIDDIEALCLSIEKRQNELSRLVKKLKG